MLANSFFENSKIDLVDVLKLLYFWSNGYTSKQVIKETKLSLPTISNYYSQCRSILEDSLISKTNEKIGGPGVVVEIDESCFSKRKYNVGRLNKNTWVFGGKERDSNKYFFEIVPDRSAKTLIEIINRKIDKESIIISDCWAAYQRLEKEGFMHLTVNHKYNFVDPETGAHTQNIESLWSLVKRSTVNLKRVNLISKLAEFTFKNQNKEDVFSAILKEIKID